MQPGTFRALTCGQALPLRRIDVGGDDLGRAGASAGLIALAAATEPADVRFAWRPKFPDPYDEMVLEAAVNGSRCPGSR